MSPRRLLVFDSDPAVQEWISGLLRREGRFVLDAHDRREAITRFRQTPCDVVVAGQGPNGGSDGFELLRRVSLLRPETKVILTGDRDPQRVVSAIRGHAYSYFHTPIAGSNLADMVQRALDARSWRDDLRLVSNRPEWLTFDVRCKLPAAERTVHFVREVLADLPATVRDDISSAFRELLINGIEHGGRSDPRKIVRASLMRGEHAVLVEIADPGKGFSMQSLPHAAVNNPDGDPTRHVGVRERKGQRPGGFGILMTRHMVDELLYNQRGNAVLFVKYLQP